MGTKSGPQPESVPFPKPKTKKPEISQRWLSGALVSLIAVAALIPALYAIDFGDHRDEDIDIGVLSEAVQSKTLLPSRYRYGSMMFDISLLGLGSYTLSNTSQLKLDTDAEIDTLAHEAFEGAAELAKTKDFRIFLRSIFAGLSLLAIIWIFSLVLVWRKDHVAALAAALFLAFSWELNTYSRYITPNAIIVQFGALTILLTLLYMKPVDPARRWKWLLFAAAAAGITCATKYQGGLFLLPVLLASFLYSEHTVKSAAYWREKATLAIVFAGTFLAITPGALLQPLLFWQDMLYEVKHYSSIGHFGHAVSPGMDHLSLILTYLGMDAFSNYPVISLIVIGFSLLGAVAVVRDEWREALVILSVPVLYVLVLTFQRVFFTRNYLILLPLLAALASMGFKEFTDTVARRLREKPARAAAYAMLFFMAAVNLRWLFVAANDIRYPDQVDQVAALADYLSQNEDRRFYASESLFKDLAEASVDVTERSSETSPEFAILRVGELRAHFKRNGEQMPSNRPGFYRVKFASSGQFNLDYFHPADDAIVVMTGSKLQSLGVSLTDIQRDGLPR